MKKTAIFFILGFLILVPGCKKEKITEKEPNGSFSTANPVKPDSEITGYLDSPDDTDFFYLDINEDRLLDFFVSGIKGVNHAIKVWHGADNPLLIKHIDDGRKSSDERIVNLSVSKGRYYIQILHGERDPKKGNREQPYILKINSRERKSAEEIEPNDDPLTATRIVPSCEITGFFSPAYNRLNSSSRYQFREEDWYSFDAKIENEPMMLNVELSAVREVNSSIYFYDRERNEIASADLNGNGEGEELKNIAINRSGTYYIMICSGSYQSNHTDPYSLKVNLSKYNYARELEPNDSFDNANIIVDNRIAGDISSENDKDFYYYKAERIPSYYRLELQAGIGLDPLLSVYDSEKNMIMELSGAGKGKKLVYPDLSIKGDFYIKIVSRDFSQNQDYGYILTLLPVNAKGAFESEPNNSRSEANRISGRMISGFSTKGDVDFFYIEYDRKVKEFIEITGVKEGEIKFSLADSSGSIVKSFVIKGNKKAFLSEIIDRKAFLVIESIRGSNDHPYTISLKKQY